jgi:hypothetical protein
MNGVDKHKEAICGKEKTFVRREESKNLERGNLWLMNECCRQARRGKDKKRKSKDFGSDE